MIGCAPLLLPDHGVRPEHFALHDAGQDGFTSGGPLVVSVTDSGVSAWTAVVLGKSAKLP